MYRGKRTLGAILDHRAGLSPDHEIMRFEGGDRLTYGDLHERARRIAGTFSSWGFEKGDKVAAQLPNCPEFVALWFGLVRVGIVDVPINVGLRGDLLVHVLNQSGAGAIVISDEWYPRLEVVADLVPGIERAIVVGESPDGDAPWSLHRFEDLLTGGPGHPEVEVEESDPSSIIFTSGTTGPSKGVVLSHGYGYETAHTIVDVNEMTERETWFTAFPLFHTNARFASTLAAMLLEQGRVVMHNRFSASRFWDTCREEGVTFFPFMGALILMLFKQPERSDDADNPVKAAWGAPAPPEVAPDFERRFDMILTEGYGMTETGIVTTNGLSERKLGSCGLPVREFEAQVHDESGRQMPPGEVGEIVVRPTEPNVLFQRYVGMPEETLEAFRDLWFHTGDRARRDEEGWFYFVDRAKDAIRRRGENISSWEVERVLNDHPAVDETAVIGVPSELSEEEVLAVVKLKVGGELTPDKLLDFSQDRLSHFAVPRYVRFVEELPKNPQQRIQKFMLREEGLRNDDWDREAAGYRIRR